MRAVWARVGAELRVRWRTWLTLALLPGIGGGLVLGALAGARRTEEAYPRFVAAQRSSDVVVAGRSSFGLVGGVDLAEVARLPQVAETAQAGAVLLFTGRTDGGRQIGPSDLIPITRPDGRVGKDVDRWKLLAGRAPDPERVDEVAASFLLAEQLDLRVGSTLSIRFFRADSFVRVALTILSGFGARLGAGPNEGTPSFEQLADGPLVRFKLVGIEASPLEFPPLNTDVLPLHLTPAFARAHAGQLVSSDLLYVRLERGPADLPQFKSGVERLAAGQAVSFTTTLPNQSEKVQRSIRLQANAVRLLALLVGVGVAVMFAQALWRQTLLEAGAHPVLRALGMTRAELWAVSAAPGLFMAAVSALVAAAVAVLVSPLAPIGLARTAELRPGLSFDAGIVVPGAAAVAVVVLGAAAVPAWRAARGTGARPEWRGRGTNPPPRTMAESLSGAGLPPTAVIGVRFAMEPGRGTGAVPVRTTALAITVALAMVAATGVFAASLAHLQRTPELYGWNWDIRVGAPGVLDLGPVLSPALAADPSVDSFSAATITQIEIGRGRVDTLGLERSKGSVLPPVIEGRAPDGPDEILLGTRTMRAVGARLGQVLPVRIATRTANMRVVGRGVFPDIGDAGQLGTGALVTHEGLRRLLPTPNQNVFFVRLTPGTDRDAAFARMRDALQPLPTRLHQPPTDLVNFGRVDNLPITGVAVLAALAAVTLGHMLATSIRRRRRDLAVLKSLGFVRRQVSLTVVWHATAVTAPALVVGLPVGGAAGRWAWRLFADQLGIHSEPVVPSLALLLTVPAAILVANVIAFVPGWMASRLNPALVLRTE